MPSVFTLEGAELPIVVGLDRQRTVEGVTEYFQQFNPAVGFGLAVVGSIVTGAIVGSIMVWGLKRAGYRTPT